MLSLVSVDSPPKLRTSETFTFWFLETFVDRLLGECAHPEVDSALRSPRSGLNSVKITGAKTNASHYVQRQARRDTGVEFVCGTRTESRLSPMLRSKMRSAGIVRVILFCFFGTAAQAQGADSQAAGRWGIHVAFWCLLIGVVSANVYLVGVFHAARSGISSRWSQKWEVSPRELGGFSWLQLHLESAVTLLRAHDDSLGLLGDPYLCLLQEFSANRLLPGLQTRLAAPGLIFPSGGVLEISENLVTTKVSRCRKRVRYCRYQTLTPKS